jgi:hypothetical protein
LAFYKSKKTLLDDAADFNTTSFEQLVVVFSWFSFSALHLFNLLDRF